MLAGRVRNVLDGPRKLEAWLQRAGYLRGRESRGELALSGHSTDGGWAWENVDGRASRGPS